MGGSRNRPCCLTDLRSLACSTLFPRPFQRSFDRRIPTIEIIIPHRHPDCGVFAAWIHAWVRFLNLLDLRWRSAIQASRWNSDELPVTLHVRIHLRIRLLHHHPDRKSSLLRVVSG